MSKNTWDDYYQKIKGRAPRPLLLDVFEKFPGERCGQPTSVSLGGATQSPSSKRKSASRLMNQPNGLSRRARTFTSAAGMIIG